MICCVGGWARSWSVGCVGMAVTAGVARAEPPVWSDERSIDDSRPVAPAAGTQREPVVVRDGDAWIVAWADNRSGPWDVRGARLDAAFVPDAVFRGADDGHHPTLAGGPAGPVLVWGDGEVVSARPIDGGLPGSVSVIGVANGQADAAGGPTGVLGIWWQIDDHGAALSARVLDGAGQPRSEAVELARETHVTVSACVATDWGFVVAWKAGLEELRLARISPDGDVLDPGGIAVPGRLHSLALASDGTTVLAVWGVALEAGFSLLQLTEQGTFVDPVPHRIFTDDLGVSGTGYDLAWDGAAYWLSWLSGSAGLGVAVVRLDNDGRPLAEPTTIGPVARRVESAQLGASPEGGLLVIGEEGDVYDVPLDALGQPVGDWQPLTTSATPQTSPVLAPAADGALLVYAEADWDVPPAPLLAVRVGLDGTVRDPSPIGLGVEAAAHAACWLGETWAVAYVLAWHGPSACSGFEVCDVYLAQVDRSGAVSPAEQVGWGGREPALASLGAGGLLVWADRGGLSGILLDEEGQTVRQLALDLPGHAPALAAGEGAYLLAWRHPGDGILVTRLDADGELTDSEVGRIGGFEPPVLAWTGRSWVVAWRDELATHLSRVGADGRVLDVPPIELIDGADAVRTVLSRWAGGVIAVFVDRPADQYRLRGLVLGHGLAAVDEEPWRITDSLHARSKPALAVAQGGELLVAYSVYDDALGVESQRLRLRVASPPASEDLDAGADRGSDAAAGPDAAAGADAGGAGACSCRAPGVPARRAVGLIAVGCAVAVMARRNRPARR